MSKKSTDKILQTMKKICKNNKNSDECYETLENIYNHISKHDNENSIDRAESIKNIIDSEFEDEEE